MLLCIEIWAWDMPEHGTRRRKGHNDVYIHKRPDPEAAVILQCHANEPRAHTFYGTGKPSRRCSIFSAQNAKPSSIRRYSLSTMACILSPIFNEQNFYQRLKSLTLVRKSVPFIIGCFFFFFLSLSFTHIRSESNNRFRCSRTAELSMEQFYLHCWADSFINSRSLNRQRKKKKALNGHTYSPHY